MDSEAKVKIDSRTLEKITLTKSQRETLDKDAMALAELIFDMYQEEIASGKIISG